MVKWPPDKSFYLIKLIGEKPYIPRLNCTWAVIVKQTQSVRRMIKRLWVQIQLGAGLFSLIF